MLCLSQALYIKIKLLTSLGELQSDFCKTRIEFYQTALKQLSYLTDFSPQLMACMCLMIVCKIFATFVL